MKTLLVAAILGLMLVGIAHADCAWVYWSRDFGMSYGKVVRTESWQRGDVFQSYQGCIKYMEDLYKDLKDMRKNADMYGFSVTNNQGRYVTKYSEADVRMHNMQCVPPNINPND